MGGRLHPKLNTSSRPIVDKYREGKVKRTLERELKVPEVAEREAIETSLALLDCPLGIQSVLSSGQPAAGFESRTNGCL